MAGVGGGSPILSLPLRHDPTPVRTLSPSNLAHPDQNIRGSGGFFVERNMLGANKLWRGFWGSPISSVIVWSGVSRKSVPAV